MTFKPALVVLSGALLTALAAGPAIGQTDINRPREVPPNAVPQTVETSKAVEDVITRPLHVSIQREHVKTAHVGETVEVTIELQNADAEDVPLTVTEMHQVGLDYPDGLPIHTRRMEKQSQPYYAWNVIVPGHSLTKLTYHVRKSSPGMVDFSMVLARGPYGNHFQSAPTSLTIVCDPDGACGPGENSLFCPQDCTTGLADGDCDAVEDGVNDPDCAYGIDPDYDPDADSDGDGVPNRDDVCPGYQDIDSDGDGRPDGCDTCPFDKEDDLDNDGACGDVDRCPGTTDEAPAKPVIQGCSCKQILDLKPGKNKGEMKHGCSPGTIQDFRLRRGPFRTESVMK
jgi:hypothetical protein